MVATIIDLLQYQRLMSNNKRIKNIFLKPVLSQSLFHQQVDRSSLVAGQQVYHGWLKNKSKNQYNNLLKSSMQLAQLNDQLFKLQKTPKNTDKQLNTFRIAQIRKKIEQFQDSKPKLQQKKEAQSLEISGQIIAQKVTDFLHQSIFRDAKINDFSILIQSKKSNKEVILDFRNYTIQLQQKQNPLKNPQFQQFQWIKGKKQRLLVYAQGKRSYCLYTQGRSQNQKILEYIRTKSLKPKDTRFLSFLNSSFQQKVVAIFGNRLRTYDHVQKMKKRQQRDYENQWSPKKIESRHNEDFRMNLTQIKAKKQDDLPSVNSASVNKAKHQQPLSSGSIFSPSQPNRPRLGSSTIFRLKGKRGIVNYQQLQQPIDLSKSPVKTPQMSISDLRIGIQQVGISDQQNNNQYNEIQQFVLQKDQAAKNKFSPKKQQAKPYEHQISMNSQQEIQQLESQYQTRVLPPKNVKENTKENVINEARKQHEHQSQRICQNVVRSIYCGIGEVCTFVSSQLEQFTLVFKQFLQPQFQCAHQHKLLSCRQQVKFKKVENMDPNNQNLVNYNQVINPRKVSRDIDQIILFLATNKNANKENKDGKFLKQQAKQNLATKAYYYNYQNIFRSQQGLHRINISKQSNDLSVTIKTETQQIQIPFRIQLDSMYQVNKSIFFYSKQFVAKVEIYISPKPIKSWEKISTIEFISKYLTDKEQDYHFKHQFIRQQIANYQISQQWQNKIIKKVMNSNDTRAFQKMLYKGMNLSLEKKIIKSIQKEGKTISFEFGFKDEQLRKYQYHVMQNLARELKSNIRPIDIMKAVLQTQMNRQFKTRLNQLKLFFIYKYSNIKDLGLIFAKVVIRKLTPLILLCTRSQQVTSIFQIYFQVQYEIDQIFMEIYKQVKR